MSKVSNSQRFKLKGLDSAIIFRADGTLEACIPPQEPNQEIGQPTLKAALTILLFDGSEERKQIIDYLVKVLEDGAQANSIVLPS